MDINEIKNDQDYQNALERLDFIFDAKKGTPEGDELDRLASLIEQYEDEHFPINFQNTD